MIGRLQRGVTLAETRAATLLLANRLQQAYPATNRGITFTVLAESAGGLHPFVRDRFLGASVARRRREAVTRLLARLRTMTGVESVGVASRIPFELNITRTSAAADASDTGTSVDSAVVNATYFETMRIALREGRAFVALVLASVGLCGLLAFAVGQRTREIGIRRALGASDPALVRLVVRQAMSPVAAGLLAGLAFAVVALPALRGVLYGIGPFDPAAYFVSAGTLVICGAAACWLPARRATRMEPMLALRDE